MSRYQLNPNAGGFFKKIKVPLFLMLVVAGFFAWHSGYLGKFGRKMRTSEVPEVAPISGKYVKATYSNVAKEPLPSGDEMAGKVFLTVYVYDWHTNTPLIYANGGASTLDGSFIGKEGLVVRVIHEDNTTTSIKKFLAKVDEWKNTGGKSGGNVAFTIMHNGSVPLIEPNQMNLRKLDPKFGLIGIDHMGKSDSEDQVIGPIEWLTNPELMRGKVVIGVYDDGDIQLIVMRCQKVGIPVNFDYKTYNPNALNIYNTDDFRQAGKIFRNAKKLDPRPIVDDQGRKTGKMSEPLEPTAFASWTPEDYLTVRDLSQANPDKLRRLATIVSTGEGEERLVMPNTLIVFNQYYEANLDKFAKLSYAIHKAAIQIDAHPEALRKAMELDTQVLGTWDDGSNASEDQKYRNTVENRLRCFKGYTAPGNKNLHIGGSAVFSFKDAMNMLSMDESGQEDLVNSTSASVYRAFGDLTVKKYPEKELKTYTPFEKFFDTRALRAAYQRAKSEGVGSTTLIAKREYTGAPTGRELGRTSYQITFRTGSKDLDADGVKVLRDIQDAYAASEYPIKIVGHTDRTGSDDVNIPLSRDRAEVAKAMLIKRNASAFGGDRISTDGKGSTEPPEGLDPNYKGVCDTCRRVDIVIYK